MDRIEGERLKFKLVHAGTNRSKDLIVEAFIDDDSKHFEWSENMPNAIGMALGTFKFFDLKRHPFSCIMLAINQIKDVCESLRPKEEIEQALQNCD